MIYHSERMLAIKCNTTFCFYGILESLSKHISEAFIKLFIYSAMLILSFYVPFSTHVWGVLKKSKNLGTCDK